MSRTYLVTEAFRIFTNIHPLLYKQEVQGPFTMHGLGLTYYEDEGLMCDGRI